MHALLESAFLFFIAHREPIFHQDDPGSNQHLLEFRTAVQELEVLAVGKARLNVLRTICPKMSVVKRVIRACASKKGIRTPFLGPLAISVPSAE